MIERKKMKNLIITSLLLLSLVACTKKQSKPEHFLDREKMIGVLYDMSLLSGIESISGFSTTDSVGVFNAKSILKKHEIDSLTFVENNRYYIELEDGTYFKMQEEIKERLEAAKAVLVEEQKQIEAKKQVETKAIEAKETQLSLEKEKTRKVLKDAVLKVGKQGLEEK